MSREGRELRGRWDSEIVTAWAAAPGFEVQVAVRDADEASPTVLAGQVIAWALVRTLGRELHEVTEVEAVFVLADGGHPTHESEFRRLFDGAEVRIAIVRALAAAVA